MEVEVEGGSPVDGSWIMEPMSSLHPQACTDPRKSHEFGELLVQLIAKSTNEPLRSSQSSHTENHSAAGPAGHVVRRVSYGVHRSDKTNADTNQNCPTHFVLNSK